MSPDVLSRPADISYDENDVIGDAGAEVSKFSISSAAFSPPRGALFA